jgi:hypothetical protein
MLAITTIYSLCSLCGPNADKCRRYNAHCNVPKYATHSKKEYERALYKWKRDTVKTETLAQYHQQSSKREDKVFLTDFEDEWMD